MIQCLELFPAPRSSVDPRHPTLEQHGRRIRELDPAIRADSPRYNAALLLLQGDACRQNVHRLSRCTGLEPSFVAQCARRLVDNGVWSGGETRCAWDHPERGAESFWADVEVALGFATRRLDENGCLHWERAGLWWKSFDLVAPPSRDCSITYTVPGEGPGTEAHGRQTDVEREPPRIGKPRKQRSGSSPALRPAPTGNAGARFLAPGSFRMAGKWLGLPGERSPTRIGGGEPERYAGSKLQLVTDSTPSANMIGADRFPEAIWL